MKYRQIHIFINKPICNIVIRTQLLQNIYAIYYSNNSLNFKFHFSFIKGPHINKYVNYWKKLFAPNDKYIYLQ